MTDQTALGFYSQRLPLRLWCSLRPHAQPAHALCCTLWSCPPMPPSPLTHGPFAPTHREEPPPHERPTHAATPFHLANSSHAPPLTTVHCHGATNAYATDAQPTTGLPRIMLALAPTSFSPVGQDLQPLRLFGANVGGLESQLQIVRLWLLALSPNIVTLQEVWNPDHIPDALPPHMTYKAGHVSGQGTGLAIAWARALCPTGTDPAPPP